MSWDAYHENKRTPTQAELKDAKRYLSNQSNNNTMKELIEQAKASIPEILEKIGEAGINHYTQIGYGDNGISITNIQIGWDTRKKNISFGGCETEQDILAVIETEQDMLDQYGPQ